jgi:hypothetical protein
MAHWPSPGSIGSRPEEASTERRKAQPHNLTTQDPLSLEICEDTSSRPLSQIKKVKRTVCDHCRRRSELPLTQLLRFPFASSFLSRDSSYSLCLKLAPIQMLAPNGIPKGYSIFRFSFCITWNKLVWLSTQSPSTTYILPTF